MSVGDRKGYLRRWIISKRAGHTPTKTGLSVSQLVDQGKAARKAETRRSAKTITIKV